MRKIRKIFFWMHLGAGLIGGLLIFYLSITGLLLSFGPQMKAFESPHIVSSEKSERLPIDQLLHQFAQTHAGDAPISAVTVRRDPHASVYVRIGKDGHFSLNPYTGEVIQAGHGPMTSFVETMTNLHRWFSFSGEDYRDLKQLIKGIGMLIFLFMIFSGIFLWLPQKWRWRNLKLILLFNFQLKDRAKRWNQHNVIGFWSAPLILILSLSGLIISHKWAGDMLYTLTGNQPPPARRDRGRSPQPEGREQRQQLLEQDQDKPELRMVAWGVALQEVTTKVPKWESVAFRIPRPGSHEMTALIEDPASWLPQVKSQLSLAAETGKVEKWEPVSEQNMGRRLKLLARFLHTGEAGGFFGQILAFLGSLAGATLVWTGFRLSYSRFFSKNKSEVRM